MTVCGELEIQTISVFLDFYRLPNQLARGAAPWAQISLRD